MHMHNSNDYILTLNKVQEFKQLSIFCSASRSQKSKMAAEKPEKLIYQPLYNVIAQFQHADLYLQGPIIQWSYSLHCVM